MKNKHECSELCELGYEDEKERRRCLVAAKKRWDEQAPGVYERYRKWIEEEDGCDGEVVVTFKLLPYVAWALDLKRIQKLYFELYKTRPDEKDWELIQSCFNLESFVECFIERDTMASETDEKIADSNRECELILKFHSRLSKDGIDAQDAFALELEDED